MCYLLGCSTEGECQSLERKPTEEALFLGSTQSAMLGSGLAVLWWQEGYMTHREAPSRCSKMGKVPQ